jgi:hypothetical protein
MTFGGGGGHALAQVFTVGAYSMLTGLGIPASCG